MTDISNQERAIELLQQLGLKEYEAKSFVALTRRESGTAKDISETSEVPRTRVYDAIRILESKGLVETQHSNPQVFRAVPIEEAVTTLQNEYVDRAATLEDVLESLEPTDEAETADVTHEVWALSGEQGIASRTQRLIEGATDEVILVVGRADVFTDALAAHLRTAADRGVSVNVGAVSEDLRSVIQATLPDVEVFVSGLSWLGPSAAAGDRTVITRLLLVDREAILVSSVTASPGNVEHEQGVFGRGFDNGLVTIVRRLMATGFLFGGDVETDGG